MSSSLAQSFDDYSVGWICALPIELAAARKFLDAEHPRAHRQRLHDDNEYILGNIAKHNIVLAVLPQGIIGKVSAATVSQQMQATFHSIKLWLVVGVAGGVPALNGSDDVRLGDVVVSTPSGSYGGVVQYDHGKTLPDGEVQYTGSMNAPHHKFLTATGLMKAAQMGTTKAPDFDELVRNVIADPEAGTFHRCYPGPDDDRLYRAVYRHHKAYDDCSRCDLSQLEIRRARPSTIPRVHYGLIGSGDQVVKDADTRDKLAQKFGIKCFEMEAAGINPLSCLVVRGVCDYCDSHKQKEWQPYAALVAAAYTRTLLQIITAEERKTATEAAMSMNLWERKRMLRWWISGCEDVDTDGDVENNSRLRHPGTCSWLFEDEKFRHWLNDLGSKCALWYNAPIGSGKTVLSAAVVEHLQSKGLRTVYFCYSFKNSSRKKFLVGLRSLAVQLIDLPQDDFPEEIEAVQARQMTENNAKRMPDALVRTTFQQALRPFSLVYVVIDGLDECGEEKSMLREVASLISDKRLGVVKWFITSRDEKRIRDMFTKLGVLEVSPAPDVLWRDIHLYLSSGLQDAEDIQTPVEQPEEPETDKIDQWTTICDGNFLYSKFVLETLQEHHSVASRRKLLEEFPSDLQQWYLRTLAKLCDETAEARELVRRTFVYLIYAEKSMTWLELQHAISIDRERHQYDRDYVVQKARIQQLCGAFLYSDNHAPSEEGVSESVRLSHKTVQDFLLQDPSKVDFRNVFPESNPEKHNLLKNFFPNSEDAAKEIGLDCIWYLSYKRYHNVDKAIEFCKGNEEDDAFLKYASAFWFRALMNVRLHDEPSSEVCSFLGSPSFWTCTSIQSLIAPYLFTRYTQSSESRFTMNLPQPGSAESSLYGHPLPPWLAITECGREFDWDFCHFLSDWYEVLASHPGQLAHCVPLRKMDSGLGRHLSSHPNIKTYRPCENAGIGGGTLLIPDYATFLGDSLFVELLQQDDSPDSKHGAVYYCRVQAFGKCEVVKREIQDDSMTRGTMLYFSYRESDSKFYIWYLHNNPLRLERVVDGQYEAFDAPSKWHDSGAETTWGVVQRRKLPTESGDVCIFYLSRFVSVDGREVVSGSCTDEEESDAESEDSNDTSCDAGDATGSDCFTSPPSATEGIVLIGPSGPPLWILLRDQTADLTSFKLAFRSKTNDVVWKSIDAESPIPEIEGSGRWQVERFTGRFDTTSSKESIYQDLRFSFCGEYLYMLDVSSIAETDPSLQVSLHSYRYPLRFGSDGTAEQVAPPQQVTYRVTKRLSVQPLGAMYTSWDKDEVVMILPPVTCKPKIIKFTLPNEHMTPTIEILSCPVYLPATLGPNSTLMYRNGQPGKKHQLFIYLFRKSQGDHWAPQDPQDPESAVNQMQPVVVRWLISRKAGAGWRPWDQQKDSQLKGWDQHTDLIRMLRGKYIDEGVKFNVPTRSGLDWTRKSYLSCY